MRKCEHLSFDMCCDNECHYYSGAAYICLERYHGIFEAGGTETYDVAELLPDHGNCPRDIDPLHAKLPPCAVHEDIRKPRPYLSPFTNEWK